MQIKLIVIFMLILLVSCDKLPDSSGLDNELIIISSIEDKQEIEFKINDMFSDYINTPIEENKYSLKWISPNNFKNYQYYKNIIILSLEHPKDSTIDLLYNRFKKTYKNLDFFSLYNLYSKQQVVLPIGAHSSIDFINLINQNKRWIKDEINNNIDGNIINKLYNKDVNDSVTMIIENKFNIIPHIDVDYKIINNSEDFLHIGKGTPYRWLVFFRVHNFNKKNIWIIFDDMLKENFDGVTLSEYYRVKDGDFYRALYEHDASDTGGPLFMYVFDNNVNNEVILISGFINNPGKNKYLLLKELELIVENIKENNYEL